MKNIFLFVSVLSTLIGSSQPVVCKSMRTLQKEIRKDPAQEMLELKEICPSLQYDFRYATANNFVGKPMYPIHTRTTFMRKGPAQAIRSIQNELASKGLGLKIWDAYRPYAVTVAFWNLIGDERYVANPVKGSGHNRGIAVDLTLIRLDNGEELPMGTGFDHFSDTAHHSYLYLPSNIIQNRTLLKTLMEKQGFKSYNEEWWHYSWPEPERFPILDIPFTKLKRKF